MKGRLFVALIAVVVFTLAGLFGLIRGQLTRHDIQMEYRHQYTSGWLSGHNRGLGQGWLQGQDAIRAEYYRQWALDFERKWSCIDVLGIGEVPSKGLLAFVMEAKRAEGDVCYYQMGDDFRNTIPELLKNARWMSFPAYGDFVCIRFDDWGKGICMVPNGDTIEYPVLYDMWPNQGDDESAE